MRQPAVVVDYDDAAREPVTPVPEAGYSPFAAYAAYAVRYLPGMRVGS